MNEVTRVLSAIEQGDAEATDQLLPLVYDELRKLAARHLAQERPGQTLQATALVNEAYLRLVGPADDRQWDSRGHFFAAAAVGHAPHSGRECPAQGREKHGGGRRREYGELDCLREDESPEDLLALHEALEAFAIHDPFKAKLVELRFFGGLTMEQAAATLKISVSSAERAWRFARAWLYTALAEPNPDNSKNESPA